MAIPTVNFIYDVDGTPVTYTDLYEQGGLPGACVVQLGATVRGSSFQLALENIDLAKNTTFNVGKRCQVEIKPQTVAYRMLNGYLTKVIKQDVAERREMLLLLEGRGYGNRILPARRFDQDYELVPKDAADVYKDIATGQGITVANVPVSFGVTIREPMLLWNRWEAAVKVAELSATDFFVDETLDFNAFKAYPDASVPSTTRTLDDTIMKRLRYVADHEPHFNKVYAAYGALGHIPGDYNEWTNDVNWWGNLIGLTAAAATVAKTGAKAIRFSTTGAPNSIQAQLIPPSSSFLDILEADWQRLTFAIKHSLTGLTALKLRLTDAASDGIYWERDITTDLSSNNWKTLDYKLPSTDPTGWTQVGVFGGTIRKIAFIGTGTTMAGSFELALMLFYLRAEKQASIAETPLLEKIITDPNTEDPSSLQDLANAELNRVKNVFVTGEAEMDGDPYFRDPGYTATLISTRYGLTSQTIRLDEITHIVGGKLYRTVLGFSSSIRQPSQPLLAYRVIDRLRLPVASQGRPLLEVYRR